MKIAVKIIIAVQILLMISGIIDCVYGKDIFGINIALFNLFFMLMNINTLQSIKQREQFLKQIEDEQRRDSEHTD